VFDGNPSSRPNLAKPELLRVRGAILAQAGDATAAERAFQVSLDIADAQGSLSWRLRTVSSQARLHLAQGRFTEARDLLADTYARFTEGFETRDLRAARALIGEIEARARADVRN
jgi:predicted ATPase